MVSHTIAVPVAWRRVKINTALTVDSNTQPTKGAALSSNNNTSWRSRGHKNKYRLVHSRGKPCLIGQTSRFPLCLGLYAPQHAQQHRPSFSQPLHQDQPLTRPPKRYQLSNLAQPLHDTLPYISIKQTKGSRNRSPNLQLPRLQRQQKLSQSRFRLPLSLPRLTFSLG